ncbi:MAG TPA: diacylglycerol kinase family protein [Miltoncostaeaceae bacterium]|nr:diacylglycerol kinase family protein [Miltoncostaeaceae bacterium]
MRVTLMHNPGAGKGEHSRGWLESLLAEAGHVVRYQSTKDASWRAALADPADLVVVAGGDGTVAMVLVELAGRGTPAAIVPLGSANNIARTLGVADADPARLARAWGGADRRPVDIGAISSPWGEAAFVESFGGGIFADVLLRAEAHPADPDGEEKQQHGEDLLAAAIREAQAQRWTLDLDGDDVSGDFIAVEAMNIREIGPHLPLAGRADPGDGLIDLVLVDAEHRDVVRSLLEMSEPERRSATALLPVRRGRRLEARFPAGCALHVDDDPWPPPASSHGGGEARLSLGDRRAEVLVPPPG